VAHAIFISLAPLDFLTNLPDVTSEVSERLKKLNGIEVERLYQITPRDFALISYQTENSFVALVTEVRMMLVRIVRQYAPQAFFTIDQQDLIQVYNLGRHAPKIQDVLARLEAELPRMQREGQGVRPLNVSDIERVTEVLDRMPLDQFVTDFVTWQPVVRVRQNDVPRTIFHEHYISMRKLHDTFLQGINLFTNMNLFKLLTTELDKRILACIREAYLSPARGSFNFNVETLLSAAFEQVANAGHTRGMVIELQISDMFADYPRFRLAQQQLTKAGAKLALDGLTPEMTDVLRCENLGSSYVKVRLDQAMPDRADFAANLRRMIEAGVHIVGTRVESEDAVYDGMRMGMGRFQGFYVNKLLRPGAERDRFMVS
jgi:EAL domain-containing protein (putative c-di-GMP-specific phosphodiesterase class I)